MYLATLPVNTKVAAIFEQDSATMFDYETVKPQKIKSAYRGYIPWGDTNDLPTQMLAKIRASEVMSPNMLFNILSCYGAGFNMRTIDGTEVSNADILTFFQRNNMTKFLLEQITDLKHFAFSVCLVMVSLDGKKIVRIKHKEAEHARFEQNNPDTGRIENIFFTNWEDSPKDETTQVYPVLDYDDPYWDLSVRMGIEADPVTGKKAKATTDRIFAVITRVPVPGFKYYPFPYYSAHFNSGWYDISAMIPLAKKAKMTNGMTIKYHVEFHKDYFDGLYTNEQISDPTKKLARKLKEFDNIKSFLSGIENAGKVWYSGYYIDPNGKENSMVRITLLDKSKEGGDYIEDAEEASNMQCYAMGVHPSLIGATPGKNTSSLSGSDKRELFTMKQSLETAFRDLLLIPFSIIRSYNKWDPKIIFEIPHLMLTTLDQGKDAKLVTNNNNQPK